MVSSPINPGQGFDGNKPVTQNPGQGSRAQARPVQDNPLPAQAAAPEKSRGLGNVRTAEEAINMLRVRLEQQLEARMGKLSVPSPMSARFEPPSAADVAGRILNFVQARLQQEADSGADPERLAELMSQARSGVEKGFSEARDQIAALGLMNEKLAADIDDSFSRVQDGLKDLEARFLGAPDRVGSAPVEGATASLIESASRNQFSFEVETADGDRVTVRMEEQQYAASSRSQGQNSGATVASATDVSIFSGRYAFSVEGNLDAGEREALAGLFADVQTVAGKFFEGDIQGAFSAAQSLNLGGPELASFSLNLTSSRTVSAYESVSQQPSVNSQLRPLGGLARDLQAVGREAMQRGLDLPTMEGLMQRLMDDMEALRGNDQLQGNALPRSLMNDFLGGILQTLQPET